MSEAIYGLIGALGGAVLGGAATITAPALTGRHVRRQEQRVRDEVEFDRMMDLRVATRDLLLILDEAREAVCRGEPADLSGFRDAVQATRKAADRCAMYGLHFSHTPSTPEMRGWQRPSPETVALRECIDLARRVLRLIRDDVPRARGAVDPQLLRRIDITFEGAEDCRRQVLGVLMDRMEELRAEMEGARP
ncbi:MULTISPECIES: hypothetical protein [Streptomyces]